MSLSKGRRAALACGMGVSLLALMVPPLAATASAASQGPRMVKSSHRHVLFDVGVRHTLTAGQIAASTTAAGALATFSSSVTDGASTFHYSMVGTNPETPGGTSSTTVKAMIVPLEITYSDGKKWDPTAQDSCDSGASALTRTQKSPLYVSRSWSFGGTAIGTGQYPDAFQRANFWKYTQPSGVNPGFSLKLAVTTLPKLTVQVPNADAFWFTGVGCGNTFLGDININWLQNYLQTKAIPSLAAKGVNTSTLPIFVVHNVVAFTNNNANDCCVLGYHQAYAHNGTQTYVFADYDNSKGFGTSVSDVSGMSHELGEWMDDPFGNNPTKPWGHVGQVSGCQSNLEVGDPLSGKPLIKVASGGFTYHVQELAFFSWFYHQTPSIGVNGWYSNNGTFRSAAAACT